MDNRLRDYNLTLNSFDLKNDKESSGKDGRVEEGTVKESTVKEQQHLIIYVVVFVVLLFIFQLDYIYKYSFNEIEQEPVIKVNYDTMSSPTENINNGNANQRLSTLAKDQRAFIAEIKNDARQQYLHVESAYGEFHVPIYTLRDYDIDRGYIPKEFGSYPKIRVNVVGSLSTNGVLIETTQNAGYLTYTNKVYIRGNKVIDVGFQKRLTTIDTIQYYDNAILIIDTLNTGTEDFIRVYDDDTGEVLFSVNAKDLGLDYSFVDNLSYHAVGDHFLAYSAEYNGEVIDQVICFNSDGSYEIISIWDLLEATEEEKEMLKEYQLNTSSDCISFIEYTDSDELVYRVKYLNGNTFDSELRIKLEE